MAVEQREALFEVAKQARNGQSDVIKSSRSGDEGVARFSHIANHPCGNCEDVMAQIQLLLGPKHHKHIPRPGWSPVRGRRKITVICGECGADLTPVEGGAHD
jgi:hypothetical protein